MVGSIIQHQHDPPSRIPLYQQFFNKADEGRAILGLRRGPGDRIFQPIVSTKNMPLLFFSWPGRRNSFLLSDFHPAGPQRWIQRYRCFVHKDEPEIVSEDLFFNSSSNLAASALASLSCKWPKSCFGRRYRYPFRLSKA